MTVHRTRLQQPVTFLSAQQTGGVPGSCAAQAFPALMSTSACPSMFDLRAAATLGPPTDRSDVGCTTAAAAANRVNRSWPGDALPGEHEHLEWACCGSAVR